MKRKIIRKFSAIVFVIVGLVILIVVLVPIASYLAKSKQQFPALVSPIPFDQNLNESDYTQASNWFIGGAESNEFTSTNLSFYTISIPKLEIEDASVAIGGEDLSESLIHYPGTALPGKVGNSVIFGHSVLPIFFNPTDYLTIFSTLPTVEKKDEVVVNYDGITYKYEVENIFEVVPTDLQIMQQNTASSNLTLVTCTPPGDPRKPKRLIVRAKLIPNR